VERPTPRELLDHQEALERADPGGMLEAIGRFPLMAREALEALGDRELGLDGGWRHIHVAGMGGSAVGGLLLSDWLYDSSPIPITVERGYRPPAFVGPKSLVVAVSYSGNTEETLSQLEEALERGCGAACITSGGRLAELAEERGLPLVRVPGGLQPRAALPWLFYGLACVAHRAGAAGGRWGEVWDSVEEAGRAVEECHPGVAVDGNPAKEAALALRGRIPLVLAPRGLASVAYRVSTQINENAKCPAAYGFYPEALHNTVMAAEGPKDVVGGMGLLVVGDAEEGSRPRRTGEASRLLGEAFGAVATLPATGGSRLARMVSAVVRGDFFSVYLGILYGVDPSSVETISRLKRVE